MDQRHEQTLLYALDVLGKEHYKMYVKSIYLYGSCARGTQKIHSDVDIFLFINSDMPDGAIRRLRSEVTPDDAMLPEVDLKISKCESPTCSRQFNENLEKDGILLWERK